MRTLIVYGNEHALASALLRRYRPEVHVATSVRTASPGGCYVIQSVSDPTDVINGVVIAGPRDLDRLRGMEADVVIEDHSFEEPRAGQWGELRDSALAMQTDYRAADFWELWRMFLHANVLRRNSTQPRGPAPWDRVDPGWRQLG